MNLDQTIDAKQTGGRMTVFFWLAAVFLVIFSSKLWLINLFNGSALPWWDQWATEGWQLYIPFMEGKLALKPLLNSHSEHRIFINRVLSLILFVLNGHYWDARLGMALNALITAGIGVAFSALAWTLLGRKHLAIFCLFNTLVFSLPFSWACTLLGITGKELLIAFAMLAIWFLLRPRLFSGQWFFGLLCALLSIVTLGSGFCAAGAVLMIMLLRSTRRPYRSGANLIAIIALLAVFIAGLLLMTNVPEHAPLHPANARAFMVLLVQNLAWPTSNLLWMTLIVWLPSLLLLGTYILRGIDERSSAEFILGFSLWVGLQDAAMAFARAGAIGSQHTILLCLALPINFMGLLLLLRQRPARPFLRKCLAIFMLVWLGQAGYGLWKISNKTYRTDAASYQQRFAQCEKNVRAFLGSDNIADLANKPPYCIPFPDAELLANALRNPHLRAILPTCVAATNKPGPLSVFVAKLIQNGNKLLIAGICLMALLTGIRLFQTFSTLTQRLPAVTNLRKQP